MAKSSSSAAAAANNPYTYSDNRSDTPRIVDGVVVHPLLTASDQVVILAVIDETGSASVGDVAAVLPDHPDPVGAVLAMVAAGVLDADVKSVLDANTNLRRGDASFSSSGDDPSNRFPGGAPLPFESPDEGSYLVPPPFNVIRKSLHEPVVVIAPGTARRRIDQCKVLHRPGIYGLIARGEIYIGAGGDVANRIAQGQQPIGKINTVFAIASEDNKITFDDARAMERMLWSRIMAFSERFQVNYRPNGFKLDAHRYGLLDRLVAQACLTLKQEGVLFTHCSARDLIAGPIAEPYQVGPERADEDVPEGEALELSFAKGLSAIVVRRDEDEFLLLQGSDVRAAAVRTATSTVSFLRAAWLHSGLLERSPSSRHYVVTRDLVFSSLSAVGQFVRGAKGLRLDAWRPIDLSDGNDVDAPLKP